MKTALVTGAASCIGKATAERLAKVARLEGLGHWWPLQDPSRGARMLREFWSSLGGA